MPAYNSTPLTSEQKALAAGPHAARAVYYWFGRYASRLPPRYADDVLSDAWLAVVRAARQYDPAGANWTIYVSFKVQKGILDGLRRFGPYRRTRWGDALDRARRLSGAAKADGERREPDPALLDPRFDPARTCDDEAVRHLTRGLAAQERRAIELYYARGLSMKAVGRALGLCESRVSQLITNAVAELRAMRSDEYRQRGDRPVTADEKEEGRDEGELPALPDEGREPPEAAVLEVLLHAGGAGAL